MSQKRKIVYVARDMERAMGAEPSADYIVVSNRTLYAEAMKKAHPNFVYLADGDDAETSNTQSLLKSDTVRKLMTDLGASDGKASILVFKNNPLIEAVVKENGWDLLNPSSDISERVENKITQVEWLGELASEYLPTYTIAPTKELKWNKEPLIIQWAHGHTGDGTNLVNSADELSALQKKFPERMARATAFVHGPSFTVNVVVMPEGTPTNGEASKDKNGQVFVGNISYQITGIPPFTDSPFATIGNDWGLTHSLLNETEIMQIEAMAQDIGKKMLDSGWKGLFGIDVMRDDELSLPERKAGRMFLIEVNARQPASAAFESSLQGEYRRQGIDGLTVFEAHLKALLGEEIDGTRKNQIKDVIIPINDGAQIVQRVTKSVQSLPDDIAGSLQLAGYNTISYANTDHNADLLRIQSQMGIMETHGRFNKRGKEIVEILEGAE
jgi:hypothetical protein